jgi:hypothetical protein
VVQKFPWSKTVKTKEEIFVGPQMKAVMNDRNFDEVLEGSEYAAWEEFRLVSDNFLCRYKTPTCTHLVEEMLEAYRIMGYSVHFLHSCLDFFPIDLQYVVEGHGKVFHHNISTIRKRYQGKWIPSLLADCCCQL